MNISEWKCDTPCNPAVQMVQMENITKYSVLEKDPRAANAESASFTVMKKVHRKPQTLWKQLVWQVGSKALDYLPAANTNSKSRKILNSELQCFFTALITLTTNSPSRSAVTLFHRILSRWECQDTEQQKPTQEWYLAVAIANIGHHKLLKQVWL